MDALHATGGPAHEGTGKRGAVAPGRDRIPSGPHKKYYRWNEIESWNEVTADGHPKEVVTNR